MNFPKSFTGSPFVREKSFSGHSSISPEQVMEAYRTSVVDAFGLIQALLPKLTDSSIVLISSVAAGTGLPNHCAISAAKAGLEGLALALAADLAQNPGQRGCSYSDPDRDGARHGRGRKDDSDDRKPASPQKATFRKGNCRYDLLSSFFLRRIHNGPSIQGGRRPFPSSNFMTSNSQKGSTNKTIVWFRKDLRLRDNPTLEFALANKREIIPVFVWDDEEGGHWSPGSASRWWLHQALKSLEDSIEKHGGRFLFAKGKPAEILPEIAKENGASEVLYSRTYDPGGLATQEAVEEALDAVGIRSESFNASLLNEPWEVKNSSGKPFQVFTPYWRNCRNGIYKKPADYSIRSLLFANQPTPNASLDDLGLLPAHPWHEKLFSHWDVSEVAGQAQVAHASREKSFIRMLTSETPGNGWNLPPVSLPCVGLGQSSAGLPLGFAERTQGHQSGRKQVSRRNRMAGIFLPSALSFSTHSRTVPFARNIPHSHGCRTKRLFANGKLDKPATRWSMRVCANSTKRVGCTTGSA